MDQGGGQIEASLVKLFACKASEWVTREAMQIHGGMGVTWELDVAHYFKRLTAIRQMFGNADWHLDRLSGAGD